MKVNLSYRVEFENIPQEINNRFLKEIKELLKDIYLESLSVDYDEANAEEVLNTLESLMNRTTEAADLITSTSSIIIGYENAKYEQQNAQNQPEPEPPRPAPEPEPVVETVDDLIEEYTIKDEVETDEH
tara:strand:+ start:415 stop:801 length:387 start_codon:yes stop_codon:yes gene_type:complete